jgi:hypothetical protein
LIWEASEALPTFFQTPTHALTCVQQLLHLEFVWRCVWKPEIVSGEEEHFREGIGKHTSTNLLTSVQRGCTPTLTLFFIWFVHGDTVQCGFNFILGEPMSELVLQPYYVMVRSGVDRASLAFLRMKPLRLSDILPIPIPDHTAPAGVRSACKSMTLTRR